MSVPEAESAAVDLGGEKRPFLPFPPFVAPLQFLASLCSISAFEFLSYFHRITLRSPFLSDLLRLQTRVYHVACLPELHTL